MRQQRTPHHGIRLRHRKGCPAATDGRCACTPAYEAWAYEPRSRRKIRRSFSTLAAAKTWRTDAQVAIRRGSLRAAGPTTLRGAAEVFLDGAKAGRIRNRSGDVYKPSALLGYEAALEHRLLPRLGGTKLSAIDRLDLQDFVDELLAEGLSASTIRNLLIPLRVIYRRAISRGELALNPTRGLELPAVRGSRDRIATPTEAAALIAALPAGDRALWATAFYAGLRRGELQALCWEHFDLNAGLIRIERSYDDKAHAYVDPKSTAGRRSVPVPSALSQHVLKHRLQSGRRAGLSFGITADRPFTPSAVRRRAATAWKKAELEPIAFHEARHTYASTMIAAGVNAKALSTYMGHSSVTTTYDRYGHLMPGSEKDAASLLDNYLRVEQARNGAPTRL